MNYFGGHTLVHNECELRCARCYYGIKSTIGSVVDEIKSSKMSISPPSVQILSIDWY